MAPNRIIIDTDPGVDDVLAMLLALSVNPDELEVAMISVTYGNVELQSCLKNAVALFHVLEKELAWRKENGKAENFGTLKTHKPIIAVGAEHPLEDDQLMADYFHGVDGLHGVHTEHPHLDAEDTWKSLFHKDSAALDHDPSPYSQYFTASKEPAHKEILRLLRESPKDTLTLIAVGPMTNFALAAAEDPETFLKAKEVLVMGGAVNVEGNITPVAEFNTYADTVATARVFALTSPSPKSTMPPLSQTRSSLPAYPEKLSRKLKLTLFPLDITTPHLLNKNYFTARVKPFVDAGSPLAVWVNHFLSGTFNKIDSLVGDGNEPGLSLHDPLTIWYAITQSDARWKGTPQLEDIRIETSGQWTRGMHVVDRRTRAKVGEAAVELELGASTTDDVDVLTLADAPGDDDGWLNVTKGNRINRIIASPGEDAFAEYLMKRVFA
ncbi:hypothetical protein VD0002_g9967 [Verticillium dahliae]|uniref:Inosine-uridine preferring nucleoside hydrolase n=2 Tax=Verticillium dahliae TaxID=27337 RepID=G2WYL4_VERDV|nr:inosine-uridine preferring nucleoside hydrolase [Verticillium dahliae VdLs.17]KAH6703486.1 inosine-uridine preferring nucleoside hydrolase [Verticillium dahliae]EGY21666.1 inosine-uridine preferring nucleoside hydrolase [Verticillium dahliae VdLs.17]PNH29190.1 hypothetical protein BJF96_g7456 [Verticillium dahliae]PNH36997.1 hypothetical protein VD0004_g9772 [Verticillium dahliae]PNH46146.1 hypothetical protein VD0003_g9068 [Verticillium dahliae]